MQWVFGIPAIILLIVGLIGQAFEMRKIRQGNPDEPGSTKIFLNKRNFKWYAIIGTGMILWYIAEPS